MYYVFATVSGLKIWVEEATTNWDHRAYEDINTITSNILKMDHPAWGTDWSEFLATLPDLTELL